MKERHSLLASTAFALAAAGMSSALAQSSSDLNVNLSWDYPGNSGAATCATRLYGTVLPLGAHTIYSKTYARRADGTLPTTGSMTVPGYYNHPNPNRLAFFYARALGAQPGQTCAQAIAARDYGEFSTPSNFVAHSEFVNRNCPPGSPDSDGDGKHNGLNLFKEGVGFCNAAEALAGSSRDNPNSSGDPPYGDGAKYVLVNAVGGLPGGTQGAPDPGNALCPNGKKVLKTNYCNPNSTPDSQEIAETLRAMPAVKFDWSGWNG